MVTTPTPPTQPVSHEQQKRLLAFFVFLLITLVLATLLVVFQVEPIPSFIDWQVEMTNGYYYPKATFAVVWMCIALPLALLFHGVVRLTNHRK